MNSIARGTDLSISLNNVNLFYDDLGEGKIPVVFIHGFPFDKQMWQAQLSYLEASHRVISLDVRGFGKSADARSFLSISLFADDLIAFMDRLGIEKAVVCGLSMGGFIALNAIKRFPQRFEALVLCDTQCVADTAAVKESRYKTIDDIEVNGIKPFAEEFIKKVFHKDSITKKRDVVSALKKSVMANSKRTITQGLTALAERFQTCSILGSITVPTLIICGREDEVTPLVQSEAMHKSIKGSSLVIVETAGHVANLEQPAVFNAHLKTFLNSILG